MILPRILMTRSPSVKLMWPIPMFSELEREAMLGLEEGTPVLSSYCGRTGTGPCSEESGTTLNCQTPLPWQFHSSLRGKILWSQTLASCGKLKRKDFVAWGALKIWSTVESGALPSKPGSGILSVILTHSAFLCFPFPIDGVGLEWDAS